MRRNPTTAGLAAGIAVVLLAGTAVSSYFAVRAAQKATEARALAIENRTAREFADRQAAEARASKHRANQEQKRADQKSEEAVASTKKAGEEEEAPHRRPDGSRLESCFLNATDTLPAWD